MKTLIDTSVKLLTPRDYQQEALERARKAFRQGFRRILIQQWTGTGKTVLMQNILYDAIGKGKKVLVIVPRDFLVDNLAEYLNRKDYGIVQTGVEFNYSRPITIALVPSLYAQFKKGKIPANFKPDLLIIEESHHILASSWKELSEHFGDIPRLGFTATPERFDGKPLSDAFDTLITTKPLRWFIDNEYLSDYRIHGASFLNVDFKKKAGEYDLAEQSRVYDNPTILGNVVDYWIENFLGIKSVYFCAGTQHSLDLAEQFNSFGRRYYGRDIAAHIDHKTPKKEKKILLDRYRGKCSKDDELFLLTNVGLFLEGLNVPETKVTGWCRKTASLSVWMQGNGRSLRFEPGRIAHIVDHANNLDEPDPMPLPDTPIIWDLNGRQKNAKSYKLICFNCENLLCNDYRDYWQSETKALLCECGCFNRIPEKRIREVDSSSERRGYDLDEEATITLLESKSIRFELNRILKKARELNAKGKKGNGFAVYRIQELFEKNGGFSFEDLKYALCDGLGYQPRFALERWKQWKSELIQNKEETKVG